MTNVLEVLGHEFTLKVPPANRLLRHKRELDRLQAAFKVAKDEEEARRCLDELHEIRAEVVREYLVAWKSPDGRDLLSGRSRHTVRAALKAFPDPDLYEKATSYVSRLNS